MNSFRRLLLAGAFLFAVSSHAAPIELVFEPIGGYGFGSHTQGSSTGSYTGPIFGARPGLGIGNIDLSLNILGAVSHLTFDGTTATIDPGTVIVGGTAAYTLPMIPLRFLVGIDVVNYIWWYLAFTNEKFTTSGLGFRVGAGYKVLDYLRVNAEYVFSSLTVTGETSGVSTDKLSTSQFQLSLSFPFSLSFGL